MAQRRPNLLLIITDQQRAPMHWPDEPGWLKQLTPADHDIARTGLTFTDAICSSCMCSPSRASLFTGLYPTQHGVTLTHTEMGARPDPKNAPAALGTFAKNIQAGAVPRGKTAKAFPPRRPGLGTQTGENEPGLAPETPRPARTPPAAG